MTSYSGVDRLIASILIAMSATTVGSRAIGQDVPLHQCAVQLKLNSRDAGYGGSGTGTLVKHKVKQPAGDGKEGYYLVTAYHNLERTNTKLTMVFDRDLFFSTDVLHDSFVAVRSSDLVVAKFLDANLEQTTKNRFRELLQEGQTVLNPFPGISLAAVGNPVFSYEFHNTIQNNIVYAGMVAEYVEPRIVTGSIEYIDAKMMVLESLSVMPGFSGGPLIFMRDGDGRRGHVAGIVVGGDPRSVANPGRFVFAVPPLDIEKAILALETNLKDKSAELPQGIVPLKTDFTDFPNADKEKKLAFSDRVVVIDAGKNTPRYQVNDEFLRQIDRETENADMIFNGGRFGAVDLSILKPSRSTFVQCVFADETSLSNANLMGARFIGCTSETPEGETRSIRVRPSLGYGITVIDGLTKKSNRIESPIIFSTQALSLTAKTPSQGALAEMKRIQSESARTSGRPELPKERTGRDGDYSALSEEIELPKTPSGKESRLMRRQFENMLTEDLIPTDK